MDRYSREVALVVTNRFQDYASVPGITTFGDWSLFTWEDADKTRNGARITPTRAPWLELFAALDIAGERMSGAPVSALDEADAVVACCWRYGSYAHVLTAGELYPDFRKNSNLSRISDQEMMRINLEFSSGLAAWLEERSRDPDRIYRRVRASFEVLPMPWRARRLGWLDEWIDNSAEQLLNRQAELVQNYLRRHPYVDAPALPSIRDEANRIVQHTYRNGSRVPVEDLHAGTRSHGTEIPGFKRLYATEINRICSATVENLAIQLAMRDLPIWDSMHPYAVMALFSNDTWSLTKETSPVEYSGTPGTGSLDARLRRLAEFYPTVYGSF